MKSNQPKSDLHVVSFSGGKDSTAMLLRMMELNMKIDKVLYCDTGMDFPDMYDHVEKVKKVVEDVGIEFVVLKSSKSFDYFMFRHNVKVRKSGNQKTGYSWPQFSIRWCTSKLKVELLNKYKKKLKSEFNIIEYIGIAYDEQYRLERENNKNTNHVHPLVDWGWSEQDALNYCYKKGYDWNGLYKCFQRVSCWCCPLQSLDDLRILRKHFPDLWQELKEMDRKTWRSFRPDYSVDELEIRFALEEERLALGLPINGHSKDFRKALKERIMKG